MHLLAYQDFPLITVIRVGVVAVLTLVGPLIFVYVFLFKMMSHMQSRLGPMEAGPHGTLQPIVEAIKFLQKEDIFPERADRLVFAAAPFVVLLSTFLLYAVVPIGPRLVVANLDTGIFFAMAVSSISVIGVLMAGWSSANKFSLIGGLRSAGQLIAYELPLILAVVGVVIETGSLSLQRIVHAQADGSIFGVHAIGNPFVLTQIAGFLIFLIAAQAELTQTPFDMPVAESELVAGYMTEYTGIRFLIFFISEFGTAFAFAALGATLFLGGWYIPGVHGTLADVLGPIALGAKIMFLGFLIFWVRFSYPRLREDQLQKFAWKVLIPVSLANIVITAILKVAMEMGLVNGYIKGLGLTLKTLTQKTVTVQYPHEKEAPPIRARGVIAMLEENCTVCMLCARECPDWCIYIEGHNDLAPPRREGGKPRKANILDRFDIDYALCMYCGICVEVCPFDALFWSPEYEYSETNIAELLHDKERLADWVQTVPEAPALEAGAEAKKGAK